MFLQHDGPFYDVNGFFDLCKSFWHLLKVKCKCNDFSDQSFAVCVFVCKILNLLSFTLISHHVVLLAQSDLTK